MDTQTIFAYDEKAQQYDKETADFWNRFPVGFLEKFSNLSGSNIIDIGCGPGRDALLLAGYGKDITCVDASRSMINICQKKGLKAVHADFIHLPFEDSTFSGAWAYTSFLHLPKSQFKDALLEMRRVVNPDGVFAVGMIEGEGEIYRTSTKVTLPRLFTYYQPKELERAFASCGFTVIEQLIFKPKESRYLNYLLKRS